MHPGVARQRHLQLYAGPVHTERDLVGQGSERRSRRTLQPREDARVASLGGVRAQIARGLEADRELQALGRARSQTDPERLAARQTLEREPRRAARLSSAMSLPMTSSFLTVLPRSNFMWWT